MSLDIIQYLRSVIPTYIYFTSIDRFQLKFSSWSFTKLLVFFCFDMEIVSLSIPDVCPLFEKERLLKVIKSLNVSAQSFNLKQMSPSLYFTESLLHKIEHHVMAVYS